MELYAGIDLHSNNSVVVVLDAEDREIYRKRLPNDLNGIVAGLKSCGTISAVAVESTYNWYWLVDGLQDAGYDVRLVNTAAVKHKPWGQVFGLRQAQPNLLDLIAAPNFCQIWPEHTPGEARGQHRN